MLRYPAWQNPWGLADQLAPITLSRSFAAAIPIHLHLEVSYDDRDTRRFDGKLTIRTTDKVNIQHPPNGPCKEVTPPKSPMLIHECDIHIDRGLDPDHSRQSYRYPLEVTRAPVGSHIIEYEITGLATDTNNHSEAIEPVKGSFVIHLSP